MVSSTLKISEPAPLAYPRSVAFIISNEFCERFNYYGMRTILVLYLTHKLHFSPDSSTVLFHVFTMLVYLCPLIGAIIADSWLGKFKTIFYLSLVYALGGVIVAVGAIPPLELPVRGATIIGLILIAIGTGGIKPCVSAFGGDQFRIPEQTQQLATFFSLFYFAINAGSMISTSITPILRQDVHCFGDHDCFSLAFGVPAMLMLLSVVIFVAGKKLYVMKPPAGNMIFGVSKCIADAFSGWRSDRKTHPRKHFLDYAIPNSGHQMVDDTKTLIKILVLYLPFPVFWALFDQQGSRWTFQATRMNGDLFGYTIKPDQMQVINPLLILGFIPLFDYVLYPLLATIGIRRPLQKLTLGGLLAAVAFLLSAFVELKIEAADPGRPGAEFAQFRIYNGMPCSYIFETDLPINGGRSGANFLTVDPLGLWEEKSIVAPGTQTFTYKAKAKETACPNFSGNFVLQRGKANSYFVYDGHLYDFEDSPGKPRIGDSVVRILTNVPAESTIKFTDSANDTTQVAAQDTNQVVSVPHGRSTLKVNGQEIASISTKLGGVYAMLVQGDDADGYTVNNYVVTEPNSVHMMWQLPQIIVITAAEIMFSVTGLEFSFTQAPQSMKSVLQACWLLSVAIGNMLVVIIAELKFFSSQAAEFTLFAGLMIVDMFIFMLLAMRYKYVVHRSDDQHSTTDVEASTAAKTRGSSTRTNDRSRKHSANGHSNRAYEEGD